MRRLFADLLVIAGLLAVGILPGQAVESVRIELGTLEGEGWSVESVRLKLDLGENSRLAVELTADRAALQAGAVIHNLHFVCPDAALQDSVVSCDVGNLQLESAQVGRQSLALSFRYHLQDNTWEAAFSTGELQPAVLAAAARDAGAAIPPLAGKGLARLSGRFSGQSAELAGGAMKLILDGTSVSDAEGGLASENLGLSLDVDIRPGTGGWLVDSRLSLSEGGLYVDPVYIDASAQPLRLHARFDWQTDRQALLLHALRLDQPGVLEAEASGRAGLSPFAVNVLDVTLQQGEVSAIYRTWLQPWLIGTLAGDLEAGGRLSGSVEMKDGNLQKIALLLDEVTAHDKEGHFGVDAASGTVRWTSGGEPQRSRLAWAGGNIYRVAMGPAEISMETTGSRVRLVDSAHIPLLDGMLEIEAFNLVHGGQQPISWEVQGYLTPVSMSDLTQALGWQKFSGKLSGVIPGVRYADGRLEVGGVLLVRVFDGEITLRNLVLEQPFGIVPRMQLDASVRDLDLETLTRTFSFGRIEGRLEGEVSGLKMESWRPVEFDAAIRTPADDTSRHRISQRAVDNISNIGGAGVGGALSRGFLRFIKEFPYEKLGISCRLQNGTCEMGGVEPADNGYYLVKGRLLPPRLDVIGFADRVDWDSLVAQIITVTRQQDVIVQ